MTAASTVRGIRWYLKEFTGESKWEKYVDRCRLDGVEPMSRRAFERHRGEYQEAKPQSSCC